MPHSIVILDKVFHVIESQGPWGSLKKHANGRVYIDTLRIEVKPGLSPSTFKSFMTAAILEIIMALRPNRSAQHPEDWMQLIRVLHSDTWSKNPELTHNSKGCKRCH